MKIFIGVLAAVFCLLTLAGSERDQKRCMTGFIATLIALCALELVPLFL